MGSGSERRAIVFMGVLTHQFTTAPGSRLELNLDCIKINSLLSTKYGEYSY